MLTACQVHQAISRVTHTASLVRAAAIEYEIDRAQTPARFAQGTGRQAKAVAGTALLIDYGNLQVPGQGVMLQAVIADDDIDRGSRQQCTHRPGPIGGHHEGAGGAPVDEQGFIAALAGAAAVIHPVGRGNRPGAIAAAHNAYPQAALLQALDQGEHDGCLAGATDSDIAHDDYRNRSAIDLQQAAVVEPATQRGRRPECPLQRPQQPQPPRPVIPCLHQPAAQSGAWRPGAPGRGLTLIGNHRENFW